MLIGWPDDVYVDYDPTTWGAKFFAFVRRRTVSVESSTLRSSSVARVYAVPIVGSCHFGPLFLRAADRLCAHAHASLARGFSGRGLDHEAET